jgi:Fe-S-cluster containining protein
MPNSLATFESMSHEIEQLYLEMGETFSGYQKSTGLSCLEGCGKCCQFPEIEASLLEMLPLALYYIKSNNYDDILGRLEMMENASNKTCVFYMSLSEDGEKGFCQAYGRRPTICRVFGVAGTYDKSHNKTLSVCKKIKEKNPETYKQILADLQKTPNVPMISEWREKVQSIDYNLGKDRYPINQALRLMIEKLAFITSFASYSIDDENVS